MNMSKVYYIMRIYVPTLDIFLVQRTFQKIELSDSFTSCLKILVEDWHRPQSTSKSNL